ncbi:c-type cytochrome biogenesis protein CcsB [Arthrobacter sp. zg-Y820]|uniref:c-type cytochrome biogenesis protein CcsB n=1 Tax=unclassified Arthrobacter TaxID=235627 RepID=UPI001E34DCE9|nr:MULTISPECIES: c-type cytochrome biogenesis protein CcsB [unclassified Arthrobacter]MCC9195602.1 c-type cytochrome biogenesis protein CcsB [Arthrobacter sp. zg-Y820]MDK1278461.1 c-type cytochrome biogenesis protein CcsB [Arthrobacter sp. zg.Y820]MDK1359934.1 c-type cytochrome biogenesis protein CcsB [Arthrobacter sp. zg-Y1219]WIB09101.1 c-type cytochrome biogenesis protein CcsB [Arthrobacter sp. zg-Y820]
MPSIDYTLAEYSELFMLLAAFAYTVAFLAFTWDLAQSSKAIKAVESKLTQQSSAAVPAGAVSGSRSTGSGRSGTSGDDSYLADGNVRGWDADGSPVAQTADASMGYVGARRNSARVAVALTVLGAVIHTAAVVARGLAAHRVPWGNMYEFCTTGALVVAVVFLLVLLRRDLRFLGTLVLALVLIMMMVATIGFPTPVAHLIPALQSYWLVIHVSVAVIASALFTLTFAMSVLQLLQADRESKIRAGGASKLAFLRIVPSAQSLENFAYRINAVAFVLWTFTVMAGSIWAEQAWGRYWGWDTKEVWSFVIWVVYAGYLHARATRGWTGTRAAWLSIVGYLCIIFNFTIVNVYFAGLHSYSGV